MIIEYVLKIISIVFKIIFSDASSLTHETFRSQLINLPRDFQLFSFTGFQSNFTQSENIIYMYIYICIMLIIHNLFYFKIIPHPVSLLCYFYVY